MIRIPGDEIKGSLRFNYMIPVPDVCIEKLVIKEIKDEKYRSLLNKEYRFCMDNAERIQSKADKIYQMVTTNRKQVLTDNSCAFHILEAGCREYMEKLMKDDSKHGCKMLALIVARSRNNVIGKNGKIPWKIKGEQKQFKELTTGNVVVMGRKSYEEIGYPLPNRENIVVSKSKHYIDDHLITVGSLQEAIEVAGNRDIYICGGYGLFEEAMPLVDKMYITEVDIEVEGGDVFFPEFDVTAFDKEIGETGGDNIKYTRTVYTRKQQIDLRC